MVIAPGQVQEPLIKSGVPALQGGGIVGIHVKQALMLKRT